MRDQYLEQLQATHRAYFLSQDLKKEIKRLKTQKSNLYTVISHKSSDMAAVKKGLKDTKEELATIEPTIIYKLHDEVKFKTDNLTFVQTKDRDQYIEHLNNMKIKLYNFLESKISQMSKKTIEIVEMDDSEEIAVTRNVFKRRRCIDTIGE
ncbi:hypothetical protein SARC_13670 [Sphaeroforma arctica JP610]|uniref:Uncharacterized protein n=1 Tax=Sphaeroforma arctica JP610 TaxID=667725 RepID=A0A0L0FCG9_9EUKA|nr:hypothetical protein SARC_13670 [Sphaeroforma arctica JP610]KNC73773.1 hypothetical protein SARC_13670 [Sphaeroforma arctica JP610]|eukprot:XP_014147675.1 hypothetical protein SARC_13670 [Sphaeroforma arctica JP610]